MYCIILINNALLLYLFLLKTYETLALYELMMLRLKLSIWK